MEFITLKNICILQRHELMQTMDGVHCNPYRFSILKKKFQTNWMF